MANVKITALTALAAVAAEDLLAVVDDPSGTPATRKATVQALLNALGTTKGDLLVYNGTNLVRVGAGTDDQVLTADSTAGPGVAWADASGGGGGSAAFTTRVAASDATAGSIAAADRTCDGTNDEVEIQAAIDEVLAAGGGTVWLSEGTFAIAATIVAKTGVTVRGLGREATSLRVPDAHGTNFDMVTGTASDFCLVDLTLDGNDPNVAQAIDGITAPVTRGLALRCRITGMQGKGIEVTAASQWRIESCRIDTNGSTDVRITAGSKHEVLNCECDGTIELTTGTSDCRVLGNVASIIFADGARSVTVGNRTAGNLNCGGVDSTVGANVVNGGTLTMDGARSVCQGNQVLSPGQNGIMMQAAELLVIGNRVEDATGFGIRCESGADAMIVGNHVRSGSATNGVWIRGTATGTVVVGNDLRNSGTTPIADDTASAILDWPAHATYGDNFT